MKDNRLFYPHSQDEARRTGNMENYNQSVKANIDCKNAIELAIRNNYDGYRLGSDVAKEIIKDYGFDRVGYVLSNTIQQKSWDGRFSNENKIWAKQIFIPPDNQGDIDNNTSFIVSAHSGLINLFVNQYIREYESLNLWSKTQMNSTQNLDFKGKVMVLSPSILKDEYKTREFQLFYCSSGFGCSSTSRGRQITGQYLKDGEKAQYQRKDFVGEAKSELLSDFAKTRLAKIKTLEKPSIFVQLKENKEKIINADKNKNMKESVR